MNKGLYEFLTELKEYFGQGPEWEIAKETHGFTDDDWNGLMIYLNGVEQLVLEL